MIKKIAAILLLVIAAMPVVYILALQGYQQVVRVKMKHELETEALTSVTLRADKILWVKKGKEILVEGKMFDIKKTVKNNDGTFSFTGLFDEEETMLVKQLQQTQQESNSESCRHLLQFFSMLQALPEIPAGITESTNLSVGKHSLFNTAYFPSPFISKPTLPPLSGLQYS